MTRSAFVHTVDSEIVHHLLVQGVGLLVLEFQGTFTLRVNFLIDNFHSSFLLPDLGVYAADRYAKVFLFEIVELE